MKMNWWRCFLDSLDSGGGHILVLLLLIMFGAGMFWHDETAGGQIITLSFGALLALVKSTKSNQDQVNGSQPPAPPPPAPPAP